MSIFDQFQKLDDLIILHTKTPVTAILRGQLALTREQIEAYQASSDKQDQTLAAQIETIERLVKENAKVQAELQKKQSGPPMTVVKRRGSGSKGLSDLIGGGLD